MIYVEQYEGLAALCISVLENKFPEQAFAKLEGKDTKYWLTDEDTLDMIKFRERGYTFKKIGEIYNLGTGAAFHRIESYGKEKKKRGPVGIIWTDKQIRRMLEIYNQYGLSKERFKEFPCDLHTIRNYLKKIGVYHGRSK